MLKNRLSAVFVLACYQFFSFAIKAQNILPTSVWSSTDASNQRLTNNTKLNNIAKYQLLTLNNEVLQTWLQQVPVEFTQPAQTAVMNLPLPDGSFAQYNIVESSVMAPELATKYPNIKTYSGQGIADKSSWVKLDYTLLGFHAMISTTNGVVLIDPVSMNDVSHYVVYNKADMKNPVKVECTYDPKKDAGLQKKKDQKEPLKSFPQQHNANRVSGAAVELYTYRLALAATGEYTQTKGGTVEGGLAGQAISINRVNGIYESELAIRLILVANNDQIVYTDSYIDPYTNNNGATMLGENQQNLDQVIGSANYDFGHVFSTGGGGIASLGAVCTSDRKAQGVTGLSNPTGDDFDVDYVAHEMGHQVGCNHTFNSNTQGSCTGNRAGNAAYEPGSGVTIMAYAGICGIDDIDVHSIPYFHSKSLDEVFAYMRNGYGNTCAQLIVTGNHVPVADAGVAYTIPKSTPFVLTGSGTDPDGDDLTYSWEEYDLGPDGSPDTPVGNAPIFRPFTPTKDPARTFPKLKDLLSNMHTRGELLPTYKRRMHFRLTVRDNKLGGGAMAYDTVSVLVIDTAGPFKVLTADTAENWAGGEKQAIQWDVKNTDKFPVNCTKVNIKLSLDGGLTFPITLLDSAANDGLDTITVPGVNTAQARIKVESVHNIFFDINHTNFNITTPGFNLVSAKSLLSVCSPDSVSYTLSLKAFGGFNKTVGFTARGLPVGTVAVFNTDSVLAPGAFIFKIKNLAATPQGAYTIMVHAAGSGKQDSIALSLLISTASPSVTVLQIPADRSVKQVLKPLLIWTSVVNENLYQLQLTMDSTFGTIDFKDSIANTNIYAYQGVNLKGDTSYFWRVRAKNACGYGTFSSIFRFETRMASPKVLGTLTGTIASYNQINLSWKDNSTNEDGFIIQRSIANINNFVPIATLPPNTIQYNDTGLTANTKYYYTVLVYNAGGSVPSNTIYKTTGNVGVVNNTESKLILVYPNPAHDMLHIQLNMPAARALQLYDYTGRLVKAVILSTSGNEEVNLPLQSLAKGLYLLKITLSTGNTLISEKIEVQ